MTDEHHIRVGGFQPPWWPGRWAYEAYCTCGSRTDWSGLTSWRAAMKAADWHRRAVNRRPDPAALDADTDTTGEEPTDA